MTRHPDAPFPCLVCDKAVEQVDPRPREGTNQPFRATKFNTTGHYGSTVWDEFSPVSEPNELEINVCDECLVKKGLEGKIGVQKPRIKSPSTDEDWPPLVLWRDHEDLVEMNRVRIEMHGEEKDQ